MTDHPNAGPLKGDEARDRTANDAFSNDEEAQHDRLVSLIDSEAERSLSSLLNHDDRFLTWLAEDLRHRAPPRGSWTAAKRRSMLDRIMQRGIAARVGIVCVDSHTAERNVEGMPLEQAVEEARQDGFAPRVELAVAAGSGRALWDEPCSSWVQLPDELPGGRYVALSVSGDSMLPLLHSGDVILVRLDQSPKRGSVVVARQQDEGYVVKLVSQISERAIRLRSVNPEYGSVRVSNDRLSIVGTVVMRWCDHATRGHV